MGSILACTVPPSLSLAGLLLLSRLGEVEEEDLCLVPTAHCPLPTTPHHTKKPLYITQSRPPPSFCAPNKTLCCSWSLFQLTFSAPSSTLQRVYQCLLPTKDPTFKVHAYAGPCWHNRVHCGHSSNQPLPKLPGTTFHSRRTVSQAPTRHSMLLLSRHLYGSSIPIPHSHHPFYHVD